MSRITSHIRKATQASVSEVASEMKITERGKAGDAPGVVNNPPRAAK
jgi:hypothetical protein